MELELEVGWKVGNIRSMDTTTTSALHLVERKGEKQQKIGLITLILGKVSLYEAQEENTISKLRKREESDLSYRPCNDTGAREH